MFRIFYARPRSGMTLLLMLSLSGCGVSTASPAVASTGDEAIRTGVAKILPAGTQIEDIKPSPVAGLSEVTVAGRIAYVTSDGKHLIQGSIVDLDSGRNLTELSEASLRRTQLAQVGQERRIVFPAANPKYRVTVFTDVDCGYCRKLHSEIAEFNKAGITVEYLLFPRGGMNSESAATAVSVWCAADRRAALTEAKQGHALPAKHCENFVAEDYALGQRIGVSGTPAIYAANGMQLGGYLTPAQMLGALEQVSEQGL